MMDLLSWVKQTEVAAIPAIEAIHTGSHSSQFTRHKEHCGRWQVDGVRVILAGGGR